MYQKKRHVKYMEVLRHLKSRMWVGARTDEPKRVKRLIIYYQLFIFMENLTVSKTEITEKVVSNEMAVSTNVDSVILEKLNQTTLLHTGLSLESFCKKVGLDYSKALLSTISGQVRKLGTEKFKTEIFGKKLNLKIVPSKEQPRTKKGLVYLASYDVQSNSLLLESSSPVHRVAFKLPTEIVTVSELVENLFGKYGTIVSIPENKEKAQHTKRLNLYYGGLKSDELREILANNVPTVRESKLVSSNLKKGNTREGNTIKALETLKKLGFSKDDILDAIGTDVEISNRMPETIK